MTMEWGMAYNGKTVFFHNRPLSIMSGRNETYSPSHVDEDVTS